MATSDKEQQSELVPQHKRLAQGAPVNQMPGQKQPAQGGLAQANSASREATGSLLIVFL